MTFELYWSTGDRTYVTAETAAEAFARVKWTGPANSHLVSYRECVDPIIVRPVSVKL